MEVVQNMLIIFALIGIIFNAVNIYFTQKYLQNQINNLNARLQRLEDMIYMGGKKDV